MKVRISRTVLSALAVTVCLAGFSGDSLGQERNMMLATEIIDQDVYGARQDPIGEVDDIVIRRSGTAKKLTVEFGAWLWDLGDKLVALPFKRLRLKDGEIHLDVSREEVRNRPLYDYYRHGLRLGYYYRTRPGGGLYPPMGFYYGPDRPNPPIEQWAFSPSRFLASVVLNRRLVNEEGQDIGWVKDLEIDLKESKVENIIVLSEELLGKNTHAPLPYKPMGFSAYGLVYDITPAQLKGVPTYDYGK